MRGVGAAQLQGDRLTLDQGDVIRREAELAGGDFHGLDTLVAMRVGGR